MFRKSVTALVLGLTATGILFVVSPAFRTVFPDSVNSLVGWTAEARQSDPAGFVAHVRRTLTESLVELEASRESLSAELSDVDREYHQQQALQTQSRLLAEEFRSAWHCGSFPTEIRGAAYTSAEVQRQVGSLLTELDGYTENVRRLGDVLDRLEEQRQEISVRIDQTQTEISALGAEEEMQRLACASETADQLVAQVADLVNGNRDAVTDSAPVRSAREILAASPLATKTSDQRVAAFLEDGRFIADASGSDR